MITMKVTSCGRILSHLDCVVGPPAGHVLLRDVEVRKFGERAVELHANVAVLVVRPEHKREPVVDG